MLCRLTRRALKGVCGEPASSQTAGGISSSGRLRTLRRSDVFIWAVAMPRASPSCKGNTVGGGVEIGRLRCRNGYRSLLIWSLPLKLFVPFCQRVKYCVVFHLMLSGWHVKVCRHSCYFSSKIGFYWLSNWLGLGNLIRSGKYLYFTIKSKLRIYNILNRSK